MKKKLLSTILSLTLVFSATTQIIYASANDDVSVVAVVTNYDDEATTMLPDPNEVAQDTPGSMLPDANEVPQGEPGSMLPDANEVPQGEPGSMLPDANEVPQGEPGSMLPDLNETPHDSATTFPQIGGTPTNVPSTGVTILGQLF